MNIPWLLDCHAINRTNPTYCRTLQGAKASVATVADVIASVNVA
jgi:hypothetical protein